MKYIKSLMFLVLLSLIAFLPINSVRAVDTLDRSCDTTGSFSTTKIGSGTWQTFTPSQNRLSKITVHVFRHELDVPAPSVTLKVYTNSFHVGLLFDAGSQTIADAGGAGPTLTYDFADKEVTPGNSYRITLTTNGDVSWLTKTGTCYRAGDAYANSKMIDPRVDYGFATYGYTAEDKPPVSALDLDEDEDQAVQPDGQTTETPTDQTTAPTQTNILVDKATLTSNVTDAIKPPTNLKAVDTPNDQGGSITLTWEKSVTEGVEGYTVFRQFDAMGDVYKIGEVKAETLKFVDTKATAGQEFFYFVRANKGEQQSNDSNKVSATSIVNIAATSTNQKDYLIWYIATGAGLAVIIAVGLFIYFRIKKKKQNPDSLNQIS